MRTAFDEEWKYDTDSEEEEKGFTSQIATGQARIRSPTPPRPSTVQGRVGGPIVYDLTRSALIDLTKDD